LGGDTPPEYQPKSDADRQNLSNEADLAFRQAFALCPYSPEAVFRYVQLLLQLNRLEDARLVAQTCLKLDPNNGQVLGLVNSLQGFRKQAGGIGQAIDKLQRRIDKIGTTTTNIQAVLDLANTFLQMQQTNRAIQVLDKAVSDPGADTGVLVNVAQQYAQMGNVPKLEATLERLVKLPAAGPEAWYDLAALKAGLGKSSEALAALKQALELSAERLQRDPKARDLLKEARRDARFDTLRQTPEFKNLVPK
jgi:tetratricopeptide (TPR) repeat protein